MARVGDNIYLIGAQVRMTLRAAAWPRKKVDEILATITRAPSYEIALAICREYITIEDEDAA